MHQSSAYILFYWMKKKKKRILFLFELFFFSFLFLQNLFWIFVVCIVLQLNAVTGILYHQNYGLLPTTLPLPLWNLNSPALTTFDHNILSSHELSKLTYGTNVFPFDQTTIYGTVKSPSDVYDDTLHGYYHNGRYLKQYFVAEDNIDDLQALNNFIGRFMPYVPSNFNVPAASKQPNLGFPSFSTAPSTLQNNLPYNDFYGLPRALPKPTQLGSGSLGFIRLPNGAVYLGSGSLGYINQDQKSNELNQVRNRQSPQAGPLTFGEAPQ